MEKLATQNKDLATDKMKVTGQLKALFAVYNKQKAAMDDVGKVKSDAEAERKAAQTRIEELERMHAKLKNELSRSEEARKEVVTEHLVHGLPKTVV